MPWKKLVTNPVGPNRNDLRVTYNHGSRSITDDPDGGKTVEVVFCDPNETIAGPASQDCLDVTNPYNQMLVINGVRASIHQWREVLLPLFGVRPAHLSVLVLTEGEIVPAE